MEHIKYHPLVGNDATGTDLIPMFFALEEDTVAKKHDLYLAEIVPHHYRLCARKAHSRSACSAYTIHCPACGHAMRAITDQVDDHRLALYVCPTCR